jgi:hypothetical protein
MSVVAVFSGQTGDELAAFVREHRPRLRPFRKVVVNAEGARILDINRAELVFPGVGLGHALLETVLRQAGAAFDPAAVRATPAGAQGEREFGCTARYPWGNDRVL